MVNWVRFIQVLAIILTVVTTGILIWAWILYARYMDSDQKTNSLYYFIAASVAYGLALLMLIIFVSLGIFARSRPKSPTKSLAQTETGIRVAIAQSQRTPSPSSKSSTAPILVYSIICLLNVAALVLFGLQIGKYYTKTI